MTVLFSINILPDKVVGTLSCVPNIAIPKILGVLAAGGGGGGGGGGALIKVLYGEAPPRGPNPYPFIYHC